MSSVDLTFDENKGIYFITYIGENYNTGLSLTPTELQQLRSKIDSINKSEDINE